jgi:hypothetical protein
MARKRDTDTDVDTTWPDPPQPPADAVAPWPDPPEPLPATDADLEALAASRVDPDPPPAPLETPPSDYALLASLRGDQAPARSYDVDADLPPPDVRHADAPLGLDAARARLDKLEVRCMRGQEGVGLADIRALQRMLA